MPPAATARNVPLVVAICAAVVALVAVALHVWLGALPGLEAVEGLTIDARFHIRGPRAPASDRVVIVGIDDATRARFPELVQTRKGYARLVRALTAYDVKATAFDVFFSEPEVVLPEPLADEVRAADLARASDPPADAVAQRLASLIGRVAEELRGDEQLAAAIAESRRVFLGAYFQLGGSSGGDSGAGASPSPEPDGLLAARHGETADAQAGGDRRPAHASAVDYTLPAIARGAVGAGSVNAFRDPDGVVRRMPLAIEYGGHEYMPLGLAVALFDQGAPRDTSYIAGAATLTAAGRALPVGRAATLALDVLGRGELPRISAADVLAGTAPRAALAGKLAFVGLTFATTDKIATPLDPVADGIELHATLAENILAGRLLHLAGPITTLLAAALLCGLVVALQLRPIRRRTWVPPAAALAAILCYVAIGQLAFDREVVVALAAPIGAAAVTLVAAMIGGLVTEGREKLYLRAMFAHYVNHTVVDRLLADPSVAKLGGVRKELTVMFSDIRGFSKLAEGMRPEAVASFLGEYLTPMTDLVLASGGTLDKYIGDAVMAIWSAPIDLPDHAARACEVALRMQESLVELNRAWRAEGKPEIAIGIGVNTGAMAVGNMGSATRFEYTVLGDQVNLAARLEALTKDYGVGILVGDGTRRAAGDAFEFREIDVVRVKGRAGAVPVFELVGRAGAAHDARFGDGLAAYRRREFGAARAAFAACASSGTDHAAHAMAARCAVLETAPPAHDWDGVYDQLSK